MVGLAALVTLYVGYLTLGVIFGLLSEITHLFDPVNYDEMGSSPGWTNPPFSTIVPIFAYLCSSALAAGVALWAYSNYQGHYKSAASALVWGPAALMLVDEQYAQAIEQARRERYRINFWQPVHVGQDFISRLNHFAHYYQTYTLLGLGPAEVRPPNPMQSNCWVEGALVGAGCFLTQCCVGLFILIPMILRIVLTWPRLVAIKQAAVDYLEGRYDSALEQQYQDKLAEQGL